ncbi:MAG: polyphosphate polymerase domain-containing protein [Bacteroidota bacterium]
MRYEYKYFVPTEKLDTLRHLILPFVDLDKYAVDREHNHYTVRSIYFDSPRLEFYDEKVEGIAHRKKVRLRGYDIGQNESTVFMEIKRKYEMPILKNRAPMTFAGAKALLSGQAPIERVIQNSGKFPDAQDNARRFLYQINKRNLRPVVCVIYDREPYLSKTDPTIRITFDKNLRSTPYPRVDQLYTEENLRHCLSNQFILEVKFNDYYPAWMKPIISTLGLKWTSASKYVISMDAQGLGYQTRRSQVISRGNMFKTQYGVGSPVIRKGQKIPTEHLDPLHPGDDRIPKKMKRVIR